ncbi:diguanylate cyclase [Acuticoccus sp. MNP-M23]|uniref:diguanylate cyclase domain-containing protein n=1 Tax=Acuticoccus sp. MNP-M23 TaxID=3072793 RepID=UPI0028161207|nr:diguanylate cyclase [Acuticoccus sp. MNP-M23]WMS43034.1 diguanylate cyclase [Acuticoccus sp. MNP-M23]
MSSVASVLPNLLNPFAIVIIGSLAAGFLFDRVAAGRRRNVLIGLIGGAGSLAVMFTPSGVAPFAIDGHICIILVASFFGGPLGALAAVPLPLAMQLELGGPAVPIGLGAIVLAALVGAGVRLACNRLGLRTRRRAVLLLAAASPLVVCALAVPSGGFLAGPTLLSLIGFLVWMPTLTFLFGILVGNELARSDAKRRQDDEQLFFSLTQTVRDSLLRSQIEHHERLHERYGVHYAYLLVALDDGEAMYERTPPADWVRFKAAVARQLRDCIRDSDVCAPLGEDRFGILLPYTSAANAYTVAERIQAAANTILKFEGKPVSVSIGLAHVDDTMPANDVMITAEGALFLASANGQKNVIGPFPSDRLEGNPVVRSFPGALVRASGANAARLPSPISPDGPSNVIRL